MDADKLTDAIQYTLSRPPSAAGRRLKSERELASLLNVGESLVRKSLNQLANKGILVRRRGSGTFVRRVADPPTSTMMAEGLTLDNQMALFSDITGGARSGMSRSESTGTLHIGLWGDLESRVDINANLLGGIARATNRRGHRLTVHSIIEDYTSRTPIPYPILSQHLRDNPCDGYLVVSTWADRFNKAIGNANGRALFFLAGTDAMVNEPMVMQDTSEAITRAVQIFANEGYKRIGMIAYKREHEPRGWDTLTYERAMAQIGINYRACSMSDIGVSQAMAATRQLLSRQDRPEAIYVADDHLLVGVAEAMQLAGIVPGRDIAVITLSNRGVALPAGYNWSRIEFDRERFCQMVVEALLRMLEHAGSEADNMSIHGRWITGDTHTIRRL